MVKKDWLLADFSPFESIIVISPSHLMTWAHLQLGLVAHILLPLSSIAEWPADCHADPPIRPLLSNSPFDGKWMELI